MNDLKDKRDADDRLYEAYRSRVTDWEPKDTAIRHVLRYHGVSREALERIIAQREVPA